jgi:hypothetical protein
MRQPLRDPHGAVIDDVKESSKESIASENGRSGRVFDMDEGLVSRALADDGEFPLPD